MTKGRWLALLLVGVGASNNAEQQAEDQCGGRMSRYYLNHFDVARELHVPNVCQSCCCSNKTSQIDCSGLRSTTIDELKRARDEMDAVSHIYLNGNELENLSHFQLMNVSSVRAAEFRENRLRVFELAELDPFTGLRSLDLASNQIEMIRASANHNATGLGGLLEVLNLAKNEIVSIDNATFVGFDSLKLLDISKNELQRIESGTFSTTPQLEVLRLQENMIRSLERDSFFGLTELVELDLSGNELSALPGNVFASLTKLRKLKLTRNQIAIVGLDSFAGLGRLHYIDLTSNWLGTIHPDAFKDLPVGVKNQIEMNDNPLMCDCELRHLVSWITHWPFRVINAKNLRCSFVAGAAAKNAGKRLLELQSHDLCDWFTELRDMILVPVVILIIISLIVVLVCVLRGRRRQFDGSMATMSTNYKSQVHDSFSIGSSHQGSSDFTQATQVTKYNIHLPASLQPATFSPPTTARHEVEAETKEKITRRHTTVHEKPKLKPQQARRTASQHHQRRRASYSHSKRGKSGTHAKRAAYSSTESDSESCTSYSEDGL